MMILTTAILACLSSQRPVKTVVCFGDKVIQKVGAALKAELAPAHTAVQTVASNGLRHAGVEVESIGRLGPDFVLIGFGTEFASDSSWLGERDLFVPRIESLITRLRSGLSHPRVFICLPPPIDLPENDVRSLRLSTEIRPLLKQAARESNCDTIDFEGALRDRIDLVNGLALDEMGVQILADAAADVLNAGGKADWRIVHADSEEPDEGPAKNAIDGDADTYWHTNYSSTQERYPHELVVDTGSVKTIGGFSCLPRQDGVNGRVAKYEFYVSLDGNHWGAPVATGVFPRGSDETKVHFGTAAKGRYFRFRALSEQQGQIWASVAELNILKFYPKRPR